jgi:hypothetical protein
MVDAERVERLHDDGVTRLHAQSRQVLTDGIEKRLGIKLVRRHAVPSWKRQTACQALSHWGERRDPLTT